MERGWPRLHPWLELPPLRVEQLVREAFPAATVESISPLTGGLRNTNLRIELSGAPSPAVLRAYTADRDACCREVSVLVSLPPSIPVPHVHFATSDGEPPWALLEWLDGMPADRAMAGGEPGVAIEVAYQAGAVLARIHESHFPRSGFLGPALAVVEAMPVWSVVLPELASRVEDRLGSSLLDAIRSVAKSCAARVDPLFGAPVLCHGDYKPWNLLVSEAGRPQLTAILDWEFAFAGPGLFDVGTYLRDEERRPAGYSAAFAEGYCAAGGTLPQEWRRLARLLDLINLCQLLERRDDATAADLLPLIEATVRPN